VLNLKKKKNSENMLYIEFAILNFFNLICQKKTLTNLLKY